MFVNFLLLMLIVSNVSWTVARQFFCYALSNLYNHSGKYDWRFDMSAVLEGVSFISYYSAMWMLSFKFWTLALKLELICKRKPEDLYDRKVKGTNAVMMVQIVFVSVIMTALLWMDKFTAAQSACYLWFAAIMVVSLYYYVHSLKRIEVIMADQLNFIVDRKAICSQMVMQLMILTSILFLFINTLLQAISSEHGLLLTIAFEMQLLFRTLSQLVLICMCNSLITKNKLKPDEPNVTMDLSDTTSESEYSDDESEISELAKEREGKRSMSMKVTNS